MNQYPKSGDIMLKRYKATMILAAVGDAMGFYRGKWQFCYDGVHIHQDMLKITEGKGVNFLKIDSRFPYSDDTVMHIATAKGLTQANKNEQIQSISQKVAKQYKDCWKYMGGKAPGNTCRRSIDILNTEGTNWKEIPFSEKAGGCGAAMRSACIGLYFHDDIRKTISLAIETGRTTHNCPIGYLGSMVAAYFTALAINNVHPNEWLSKLLKEGFPLSRQYIQSTNRDLKENFGCGQWQKFQNQWKKYANLRKMQIDKISTPSFPQKYGVEQRQQAYRRLANNGWPGALGLDSVIISYDALLSSLSKKQNLWQQVCERAALHGGDNDSTGTIAGAWYGAYYGFNQVPQIHYNELADKAYIENLGEKIYKISRTASHQNII